MKILCAKCKKEMKDFGNYISCRSGLCDITTSTYVIPKFSLEKHLRFGTITVKLSMLDKLKYVINVLITP